MRKLTTEIFIERSQKAHGIKKFNYSEVKYINNTTKVKIYCNKCKKYFWQPPCTHMQGMGCQTCKGKAFKKDRSNTKDEALQKIYRHYPNANFTVLNLDYENNNSIIKLKCNICGCIFTSRIGVLMNGQYTYLCYFCAGLTKTTEDFIKRCKRLYDDMYDYSNVNYVSSHTKVDVYCPACKKYFKVSPNNHLRGRTCPYCSSSSGEKIIQFYLDKYSIYHESQFSFDDCRHKNRLSFDFAIFNPDNTLHSLIEFDGRQHYKPIEFFGGKDTLQQSQLRDQIKNTYCQQNNIPLLRIPYFNIDTIPTILSEHLDNLLI